MSTPCTVILRNDLPATERELLRRYCHELHGSDGASLLQFLCTHIDPSHPHYLEIDAILPRHQGTRRLRLPHTLVFLIEGHDARATDPALPADSAPVRVGSAP